MKDTLTAYRATLRTPRRSEEMAYALGVDIGFNKAPTACAMLGFQGGTPLLKWTHSISGRGKDWQGRVNFIAADFALWLRIEVLPYWPPFLVAFELAHVQSNPQTALRLADLAGAIRGIALAYQLDAIGVEPSQSKVALANSSTATKADMMKRAALLFGRSFTEHEADAVAHALSGQAIYHRSRLIAAAQEDRRD